MGSSGDQDQTQQPGTLSPVTATLQQLFGSNVQAVGGQFQPQAFQGRDYYGNQVPGSTNTFTPGMFNALPGLLANQPLTGAESALLGVNQFGQFGGGVQGMAANNALQANTLLGEAAQTLSGGPQAAIAAARRGFTEETLPAILERAPGWSSSDLQRELARAGTDLDTNIAAMKEMSALQMPQFTQALGTQLLDNVSNVLGFGQLGRDLVRENSAAGDAFRVLSALQGLTGPSITSYGHGGGNNKSVM